MATRLEEFLMNRFMRYGALVLLGLLPFLTLHSAAWAEPQNPRRAVQDKENAAKGKIVYEDHCAVCHSADSEEAIVGPGLKGLFHWPPHKMSDGTEHKEHTVEIIRNQIVNGGGSMAPVGASLSSEEIDNLIAYLQTL
jgi:mono/diheme cytochrome c family protein